MKKGTATKQPQQTRGSCPSERGDPLHAGARVTRYPAPGIRANGTAGCCARFPFSKTARVHAPRGTGLRARENPVEPPLKNPRERTGSGELPAELARQHRSLWHGAVCTLRAAIHSPAAGAQLPGSRAANVALICGLSRPTGRRVRVAPLGAGRSRARFGPTQDSRQNGSLACGVWHSSLPLSVPPRHRLRRRCSSFVRVWPFPPLRG